MSALLQWAMAICSKKQPNNQRLERLVGRLLASEEKFTLIASVGECRQVHTDRVLHGRASVGD